MKRHPSSTYTSSSGPFHLQAPKPTAYATAQRRMLVDSSDGISTDQEDGNRYSATEDESDSPNTSTMMAKIHPGIMGTTEMATFDQIALPHKHRKSISDGSRSDEEDTLNPKKSFNSVVAGDVISDRNSDDDVMADMIQDRAVPTPFGPNTPSLALRRWWWFRFELGFKRMLLVVLYFSMTVEVWTVLEYVKLWLALPFSLGIFYLGLICSSTAGAACSAIKYHRCTMRALLVILYLMKVLILIVPPANSLIASSKVYDFRDIMDRNMMWNTLMWICFATSVIAMVFIDIVIVHHHHKRVETYKLAVVKYAEYELSNQWNVVPRQQWGNAKNSKGVSGRKRKRTHDDNESDPDLYGDNSHNPLSPQSNFERVDLDQDSSSGVSDMDGEDISIQYMEDDEQNERSNMTGSSSHRDSDDAKLYRKPIPRSQWLLILIFLISSQLCVLFAVWDTHAIEWNDTSGPPDT